MNKILKRTLITIGAILGVLVLVVGSYAIYVFAAYYRIEDNQSLEITDKTSKVMSKDGEFVAMTYNIGFGAYSPDFSFFMDGGKESVGKSKEAVAKNIDGSVELVNKFSPDFMLIQEVDLKATRSYGVNQYNAFLDKFDTYDSSFAVNYDSPFLMYPLIKPHGKSLAGINTMSRYNLESAVRRSLPISTSFSKLFDLDRCFSVNKIPVEGGKSLYIYNLHLSAYGGTPEIREAQLNMLFTDIKEKMADGNYVVCGGDFNHDMSNETQDFNNNSGEHGWAQPFPFEELPEGLKFADNYVDNTVPSARNCDIEYTKGVTKVFLIDGFLYSGNIESVNVEVVNNEFLFSDHNPVVLRFKLK